MLRFALRLAAAKSESAKSESLSVEEPWIARSGAASKARGGSLRLAVCWDPIEGGLGHSPQLASSLGAAARELLNQYEVRWVDARAANAHGDLLGIPDQRPQ